MYTPSVHVAVDVTPAVPPAGGESLLTDRTVLIIIFHSAGAIALFVSPPVGVSQPPRRVTAGRQVVANHGIWFYCKIVCALKDHWTIDIDWPLTWNRITRKLP